MSLRTLSILASLAVCSTALADVRAYRGPHPVDLEGRWHHEAGLHAHDDLPVGLEPFAHVDGALVFLGDPIAFGFPGDVWTYRGVHPLPGALAYCAIESEHRHAFAPEGAYRRDASGAHAYVGALRGGYRMVRPARLEPSEPIAPPTSLAIGTTFFAGGCMFAVFAGDGGAPVTVPLECEPVARPPERALPPPPRSVDGRYTRVEARPMRAPARVDRRRQR